MICESDSIPSSGFNGAVPMKARNRARVWRDHDCLSSFNGAVPMKARNQALPVPLLTVPDRFNGAVPMKARNQSFLYLLQYEADRSLFSSGPVQAAANCPRRPSKRLVSCALCCFQRTSSASRPCRITEPLEMPSQTIWQRTCGV